MITYVLTMNSLKNIKNSTLKILNDFFSQWQSRNTKYKKFKTGSFAFLIGFIISLCFFLYYHSNSDIISKISSCLFFYLFLLSASLYINSILIYKYVFNNIYRLNKIAKYSFFSVIFLLLLPSIIIFVPMLLLLRGLKKLIEQRAKTADNLYNLFLCLMVGSILITWSLKYIPTISAYFCEIISNLIQTYLNLEIKEYPLQFFLLILILKIEFDCIYIAHLKFTKTKLNMSNKSIKSQSEKNTREKNFEEYSCYIKNTFLRIELQLLIILFVCVTFSLLPNISQEWITQYQSDTINVLTVYTLILLYLDKRKVWE